MPVTQPRPSTGQVLNHEVISKLAKTGLKLNVPGFTNPSSSACTNEAHLTHLAHSEKIGEFRSRPISRLPKEEESMEQLWANTPSSYFAGSKTASGTENVPIFNNTYLRPNAKFVGTQQSGSQRYDIKVEIKTVDLISSVVTGFFEISGLTDEHPLITTCFKGEIINNPLHRTSWGVSQVHPKRYSFATEEGILPSLSKNDMEHWKKLAGCAPSSSEPEVLDTLKKIYSGEQDPLYIYMRWKEEFLLPDSRVKSLTGASFEGFYYVVLNIGGTEYGPSGNRIVPRIAPGAMSGLYFYTQSEKFQSLSLKYVEERGQSSTFKFA